MSETKTKIEKIKDLLFAAEEVVVEEVVVEDFTEAKTVDGVILNITAVEKDGVVEIVSEDGKEIAAAGEYVMEDGSTIVVGEDGIIMEVKVADEKEEEVVEEEMEEVVVEEEVAVEEEANPLEARLDALESLIESKFSALGENFATIIASKEDEIKSLEEKFEAFAKAPAKKEVKVSKSDARNNKALALGNLRRK